MKPLKYIDCHNKCGSCEHFEYLMQNEILRYRGRCMLNIRTNVSNYHQASQNACKKYKEGVKNDRTERTN